MRWYLYRQYFLSTSNYRDGFNAGPLSRLVPNRFLPAGLGERDRPERIITHPLSDPDLLHYGKLLCQKSVPTTDLDFKPLLARSQNAIPYHQAQA